MSRKPRSSRDLKRPTPSRDSYRRILIVCEGSKTEPNYFEELKDDLKLHTAEIEIDGDSDPSPKSVVEYAKKRYQQNKDYDLVYCVIDKDSHETYTQALNTIKNQQPAGVFHAITSVPCFEYWLLLHFVFTTKPYARSGTRSPADCVIDDLEQKIPGYQKGNKQIYTQLRGEKREDDKTKIAIKNAERANRQAELNNTDNPTTQVHLLVKYLYSLKTR